MIFVNLFLKGYSMTAFEQPDFSFPGLQFNKDIFENPLTTSGTVPDPLPITELDTNNIQALDPATAVNLYTNHQATINLGGSLVQGIVVQALDGLAYIAMQTKNFYIASFDSLRQIKTVFDLGVDIVRQEYYADPVNTTVKTAEITVSNYSSSLAPNEGLYSINANIVQLPNNIYSQFGGQNQILYESNTGDIRIGNSGSSGIRLLTDTFVDTLRAITPASSIIDLYTNFTAGTTSVLTMGNSFLVSLTARANTILLLASSLTVPNTIVSTTIGSVQNLFATTTADINIGGATSGIRLLNNTYVDSIRPRAALSSTVLLYNNFASGTTSTIAFGNAFLVSLTTRAKALITHFDTYNLRSNTNANQRIQQTFPDVNSTQEQFYVDNANAGIITAELTVTRNATTPTVDRTGTYSINAGSLITPNTVDSVSNATNQLLYTSNLQTIQIGNASGVACQINPPLLSDTIRAINPSVASILLYTNFITGVTSALQFGNEFLSSMDRKAKAMIDYVDNYTLRSNVYLFSKIQDVFVSSVQYRKAFFVDNGNGSVETCKIEIAQGATPTVTDTGLYTITSGTTNLFSPTVSIGLSTANTTVGLNARTVELSNNLTTNTVVNVNGQLVPRYAYNSTSGVANTLAIGYTYTVTPPSGVSLPNVNLKTAFTASTITIPTNGVYLIDILMAIQCVTAGSHNRSMTYCDIYNGAGVFQKTVGFGLLPSITGIAGQVYPMAMTGIYALNGTSIASPWTFRLRFEYWYINGTWQTFAGDFRYLITRIA